MKPGRELDAFVAEKVMGWSKKSLKLDVLPHFSTDLDAAYSAADKVKLFQKKRPSLKLEQDKNGSWSVIKTTKYDIDYFSSGETAAHAICLAALKAAGFDLSTILVHPKTTTNEAVAGAVKKVTKKYSRALKNLAK